jgi:phage N-6-adenine-methyltransferase
MITNKIRNISKQTLSFSCSKSMKYVRTPLDIWKDLNSRFKFTLDACASDTNHLLPRYYTEEDSCLNHDWTGEVVYCHPMFDRKIDLFVKKAYESNCTTVMLLPASTHTQYFHKYIYHNSRCSVEFLKKPVKGFNFGHEDGSFEPPTKVGYIKPLMVVVFNG